MATFARTSTRIRLDEPGFFGRPASRWLALACLAITLAACAWIIATSPPVEVVLKAVLFTVPATGYLLFRSFVRQA